MYIKILSYLTRINKLLIIVNLVFISILKLDAQTQGIRVKSINEQKGLSQAQTNTIFKDSRGYIWFGTNDGLNRYDGHRLLEYKFDPNDLNTISDNYIKAISEDFSGRLWIATDAGGLNVLDMRLDKITRIPITMGNVFPNRQVQIWDLEIHTDKTLWIATWQGLYSLDINSNELSPVKYSTPYTKMRSLESDSLGTLFIATEESGVLKLENNELSRISHHQESIEHRMYDVQHDDRQHLWIGTSDGLLRYNQVTEQMERVHLVESDKPIDVTTLDLDNNDNIWIGTVDHGLFHMDTRNLSVKHYPTNPLDVHGLTASGILDIYYDSHQILWIATRGDGIYFFDTQPPYQFYGYMNDDINYLSNPSVRAILTEGPDIWIGGYGGLDKFRRNGPGILHFDHLNNSLENKNVYSLLKDREGALWIGTEGGGLYYLDKGMRKPAKLRHADYQDVDADQIYELYESISGRLYLGTGAGLFYLEPNHAYLSPPTQVNLRKDNRHSLDAEDIYAINQDEAGMIYVGTGSAGVYVIDENHKLQAHYMHNVNDPTSISSNRIKVLHIDKKGNLWIGTQGRGLNKLEQNSSAMIHFGENDGLSDNTIYGILEDDRGRLWLSTNNGVTLFDEENLTSSIYGTHNGLQGMEFNTGAFHQSQDGEMYFGGVYGLNAFHPEDPELQTENLSTNFTSFKVSNRKVPIGSDILPVDINYVETLELSYTERLISFEFSSMDFLASDITRYRYMIPEVDDEWIYTEPGNNFATYTDLPAGKHELQVQSSRNSFNQYGETLRLKITKTPPPWNSWWSRSLLGLLLLTIIIIIRKNEINKIRLKADLLQKKQEAKKLNEIDDMKSRLISNVSYEIRTPLTLLGGHLEAIDNSEMNVLGKETRRKLDLAYNSLTQVNELSKQLFDLAAFTSGRIKLQTRNEKLATTIEKVVDDFRSQGLTNDLKLIFTDNQVDIDVYLDTNKFEQIMINLLSNAVKYSDPQTTINVELVDDPHQNKDGMGRFPKVAVSNIGRGIDKSTMINLFDRLYEIDSSGRSDQTGAGIGLALVKELVELHGGTIQAESTPGGQTRFEFTIPTGTDHLLPDEICMDMPQSTPTERVKVKTTKTPGLATVLIVDDETSMLSFLKEGLEDRYNILLAEDGVKGFALARDKKPDIVIADIVMPKKDGFQLLMEIREDSQLSQTPVILLTGQAEADDRLKAFKAAANDFINKPFHLEELIVRVDNILTQREQLIKSLKGPETEKFEPEISPAAPDDTFYSKLQETINEKVETGDLTVDSLAKAMFLSNRQLERKTKDSCGQTPADMIRQARLFKAQSMLKDGTYATVAEVAYSVGFKNVKYFSRLFKKQLNKNPKDILKA